MEPPVENEAPAYIPPDARWYLAEIILEHRVQNDPDNVVHINLHLVEAGSPEETYGKAIELGRAGENAFQNTDGGEVRTVFRGLRSLNVVHEELEDGAELAYDEYIGLSEEDLLLTVRSKDELGVFAPRRMNVVGPNYMPGEVMKKIEAEIFKPDLSPDDA